MTYFDLHFLGRCFFLLAALLLFLLCFVRKVDLYTKRVPQLVDRCTVTAYNAADKVLADLKLDGLSSILSE